MVWRRQRKTQGGHGDRCQEHCADHAVWRKREGLEEKHQEGGPGVRDALPYKNDAWTAAAAQPCATPRAP